MVSGVKNWKKKEQFTRDWGSFQNGDRTGAGGSGNAPVKKAG